MKISKDCILKWKLKSVFLVKLTKSRECNSEINILGNKYHLYSFEFSILIFFGNSVFAFIGFYFTYIYQ